MHHIVLPSGVLSLVIAKPGLKLRRGETETERTEYHADIVLRVYAGANSGSPQ